MGAAEITVRSWEVLMTEIWKLKNKIGEITNERDILLKENTDLKNELGRITCEQDQLRKELQSHEDDEK